MPLIRQLTLSRRAFLRLAAGAPLASRLLAACGGGGGGGFGSNTNIDHDVLVSDADGYNGRWTGSWVMDNDKKGEVVANVGIDPEARTLQIDLTVTGDIFADGVTVAPFTVSGEVDSFTYGDDGEFQITKTTALGKASIRNGAQIGSGKFVLDVESFTGHPALKSLRAEGVANRGGMIPTTFTLARSDGSSSTGNIFFLHDLG